MISSEWRGIVETLTERTTHGELEWRENQFREDQFELILSGQTIMIGETEEGFRTGIRIELLDRRGRILETVIVWDNEEDSAAVRSLWNMVRRKVLRVDEALQQLKEALG